MPFFVTTPYTVVDQNADHKRSCVNTGCGCIVYTEKGGVCMKRYHCYDNPGNGPQFDDNSCKRHPALPALC